MVDAPATAAFVMCVAVAVAARDDGAVSSSNASAATRHAAPATAGNPPSFRSTRRDRDKAAPAPDVVKSCGNQVKPSIPKGGTRSFSSDVNRVAEHPLAWADA